jgi:Tfp pilus assembly pilus retraction ATPase PilT
VDEMNDIDINFEKLLKALKEKPDYLVLGEIRELPESILSSSKPQLDRTGACK